MKSESLPYHIKPSFQCYPHTTVVFFYWHAHTKITNLRTHKNYIKSKLITPSHTSIEPIRTLEIFGNRIWPQARSPPPNRLPRGNIDIFRFIDRSIWSMSLNYVWLLPTSRQSWRKSRAYQSKYSRTQKAITASRSNLQAEMAHVLEQELSHGILQALPLWKLQC